MEYNPELSTRIYEFLADRNHGEFTFTEGCWHYALLRSRYDDETDFLYMLSECHSNTAHALHAKAEHVGIYSHLTGKAYGNLFNLRFLAPERCVKLDISFEQIIERTTEAILRKIGGKPVPETENSDKPWRNHNYYLRYELDREAAECFYKGIQPTYQPKLHRDTLTLQDIVGGINHPDETADRLADIFIADNSKIINQRLWELSLLPDKIAELEVTPGEHQFRRRISRAVGDEKMVRMELMKNGISCECKIKASSLKYTGDSDYSTWNMDASGRAAFVHAYGREARLFPSDIQRICYGKKVLYQKEEQ